MKNVAVALIALLVSGSAFAGSVTCTLNSGKKTSVVTQDLAKLTEDAVLADDSTYDLFMGLVTSCEKGKCEAEVILMSAKQQDDFSYEDFTFFPGTEVQTVYMTTIKASSSPDRRKYVLTCKFSP